MLRIDDWLSHLNLSDCNEKNVKVIKFIFLWMKYNEWYSKFGLGDSEGAQKLSDDKKVRDVYEQMKNKFLNGGDNITKGFAQIPLETNSNSNETRKGLYKNNNNLLCAYNEEVNCLCKYLKVVYKIRCNFFHGSKYPSETNVLLIVWAYETLKMFLQKLIDEGLIDLKL